jgi:hypothetical protein
LKCDGTSTETRFRLSGKRTGPFTSAGASAQSTTGGRAVRISVHGSYCSCKPVFCSHVTLTGYPLHSLCFLFTSPPMRHRVSSHFKRSPPAEYESGQASESVLTMVRHAQKNISDNVTFINTVTLNRLHVLAQLI